jgi:hypothetical protein
MLRIPLFSKVEITLPSVRVQFSSRYDPNSIAARARKVIRRNLPRHGAQEEIMSRIVRFHRTGGPEVLQFDDLDIGSPKALEVRIRVRALGLNRAEAMFRAGAYLEATKLPARLGWEAAGEIEAIGPGAG